MFGRGDFRRAALSVLVFLAFWVFAAIVGLGWQVDRQTVITSNEGGTDDAITSRYRSLTGRQLVRRLQSHVRVEASVGGTVASTDAVGSYDTSALQAAYAWVLAETQRLVGVEGLADTVEVRFAAAGERVDCPAPMPSFEGGILGRDASFVVRCPDGPVVFVDIGIYARAASRFGSKRAFDVLRVLLAHEVAHVLAWASEDILVPLSGESEPEKRADCFAVLLLQEEESVNWRAISRMLGREMGPEACWRLSRERPRRLGTIGPRRMG